MAAANVRGYDNENGSDIYALPPLRFANERTVDSITDKVIEVNNVARDNFTPKTDRKVSYLLTAAAVALVIFGILAAVLASATGIGAGIIAAGTLIGLVSLYLHDKTNHKEESRETVELVHRDATRHRVAKAIQTAQEEVEGDRPVRGQRGHARQVRYADRRDDAFVPHRQLQPAGGEPDGADWMNA